MQRRCAAPPFGIKDRYSRAYCTAADRWLREEVDARRLGDTEPVAAARRLEEARLVRGELGRVRLEVEA